MEFDEALRNGRGRLIVLLAVTPSPAPANEEPLSVATCRGGGGEGGNAENGSKELYTVGRALGPENINTGQAHIEI